MNNFPSCYLFDFLWQFLFRIIFSLLTFLSSFFWTQTFDLYPFMFSCIVFIIADIESFWDAFDAHTFWHWFLQSIRWRRVWRWEVRIKVRKFWRQIFCLSEPRRRTLTFRAWGNIFRAVTLFSVQINSVSHSFFTNQKALVEAANDAILGRPKNITLWNLVGLQEVTLQTVKSVRGIKTIFAVKSMMCVERAEETDL